MGFFDAPKPQQLVFGDGTMDCVKVDAIRCRSNALIHHTLYPLPVASIVDDIELYDDSKVQGPRDLCGNADFYFIDAGEPLDNPLEALPYTGPNWYWRENAEATLFFGMAKGGRVLQSHVIATFKAIQHAEPDALAKPYAEIEKNCGSSHERTFESKPLPAFL